MRHNIRYVDQLLSLNKQHLLSIKELEEKSFVKLNKQNHITAHIKKYSLIVDELTTSTYNYKLKPLIISQMKEAYYKIVNLKDICLLPVMANPFKETPIIVKIELENRLTIAFGIIRKVIPKNILFATHMITKTRIDEKGIVLVKYQGCHLNLTLSFFKKIFSAYERGHISYLIVINYMNAY